MSTEMLADPVLLGAAPREKEAARAPAGALFWPGLILSLAVTSIAIGIIWDISWHISIGRDTFWTPAHLAIYFGGALGGLAGGWLAFQNTFLASPEQKAGCVSILGARAPLGAWVTIWGAVAMLTSAPFDDWWHNAYGLDVRIVSPPHAILGLGMLGISVGALLLTLAHQNRSRDVFGSAMFIYVGGIFITLGGVFALEFTTPNLQHAAPFYYVAAATFAFRLVLLAVAGRISWPATRASLVYFLIAGGMTWILPLFPAQPKLAPVYNPVTHMVPPAFPLLLFFPAVALDLVVSWLRKREGEEGERPFQAAEFLRATVRHAGEALLLGAVFLAVFVAVQWEFSKFILSPAAQNWFFAGGRYFGYLTSIGPWSHRFWQQSGMPDAHPLTLSAVTLAWIYASIAAWIGLLWGKWMRKVQR